MAADNIFWIGKYVTTSGKTEETDFIFLNGGTSSTGSKHSIQDYSARTTAPIEIDPIPLAGSSNSVGVTLMGQVTEFRIEGTFVEESFGDLQKDIQFFATSTTTCLMNGTQKDSETTSKMGYHFRDGLEDVIHRVAIIDFTRTWAGGEPLIMRYTLAMKEIRTIG